MYNYRLRGVFDENKRKLNMDCWSPNKIARFDLLERKYNDLNKQYNMLKHQSGSSDISCGNCKRFLYRILLLKRSGNEMNLKLKSVNETMAVLEKECNNLSQKLLHQRSELYNIKYGRKIKTLEEQLAFWKNICKLQHIHIKHAINDQCNLCDDAITNVKQIIDFIPQFPLKDLVNSQIDALFVKLRRSVTLTKEANNILRQENIVLRNKLLGRENTHCDSNDKVSQTPDNFLNDSFSMDSFTDSKWLFAYDNYEEDTTRPEPTKCMNERKDQIIEVVDLNFLIPNLSYNDKFKPKISSDESPISDRMETIICKDPGNDHDILQSGITKNGSLPETKLERIDEHKVADISMKCLAHEDLPLYINNTKSDQAEDTHNFVLLTNELKDCCKRELVDTGPPWLPNKETSLFSVDLDVNASPHRDMKILENCGSLPENIKTVRKRKLRGKENSSVTNDSSLTYARMASLRSAQIGSKRTVGCLRKVDAPCNGDKIKRRKNSLGGPVQKPIEVTMETDCDKLRNLFIQCENNDADELHRFVTNHFLLDRYEDADTNGTRILELVKENCGKISNPNRLVKLTHLLLLKIFCKFPRVHVHYYKQLMTLMTSPIDVNLLLVLVAINLSIYVSLKQERLLITFIMDLVRLPSLPVLLIIKNIQPAIVFTDSVMAIYRPLIDLIKKIVCYEYVTATNDIVRQIVDNMANEVQKFWFNGDSLESLTFSDGIQPLIDAVAQTRLDLSEKNIRINLDRLGDDLRKKYDNFVI